MKYCNSSVFGLTIASLSVIFYIIGAVVFTLQIINSEKNLQHNNVLSIIFLILCLIMSIVTTLLIFGIVKVINLNNIVINK